MIVSRICLFDWQENQEKERGDGRFCLLEKTDLLVLGPAGWFQRAWSFEAAAMDISLAFSQQDSSICLADSYRLLMVFWVSII